MYQDFAAFYEHLQTLTDDQRSKITIENVAGVVIVLEHSVPIFWTEPPDKEKLYRDVLLGIDVDQNLVEKKKIFYTLFTDDNDAHRCYAEFFETPDALTPTRTDIYHTIHDVIASVRKKFGREYTDRVSQTTFEKIKESHAAHSSEMLMLLEHCEQGDLRHRWVYASCTHPSSGITLPGVINVQAKPGARCNGMCVHYYAMAEERLSDSLVDHYDFVFVSHP